MSCRNYAYAEKLKDPRWQKKRLEIFERDKWKCVNCDDGKNELQVHHYRYEWGQDPWEYENEDLDTVCKGCHEYFEFVKEAIKQNLDSPANISLFCHSFRVIESGWSNKLAIIIREMRAYPEFRDEIISTVKSRIKDRKEKGEKMREIIYPTTAP